MIAAAMTFVVLSIFGLVLQQKRIERLEAERDALSLEAARYQQAAADNLTSLQVVLDAHARDIVLDPVGSDLLPDESLSLVKGGRS